MMNVKVQRCPLCGSKEAQPLLQVLARRMVRCQGCGLLYRNPRPTAGDPPHPCPLPGGEGRLEDGVRVREERVGARRSHQFRRFLRRAGPPGRLLDVGCGYGFFLVQIRKLLQELGHWRESRGGRAGVCYPGDHQGGMIKLTGL